MTKLIKIVETDEEAVTRQALSIIVKAVRECNDSIRRLKELVERNGGRTDFLVKVGDNSDGIVSAYTSLKTLVEDISDLSMGNL